jgi:hypothetical protein
MGNLNEKNYAKYSNPEEESVKDLDKETERKHNNIPYSRSKSEQKDKQKLNTQSAKRSGAVKDKQELGEGKGARKTGTIQFKAGTDKPATKANQNLEDAKQENPKVTGRKTPVKHAWDDAFYDAKNSKPKGKSKKGGKTAKTAIYNEGDSEMDKVEEKNRSKIGGDMKGKGRPEDFETKSSKKPKKNFKRGEKPEMFAEQLTDFVNAVARDDYSQTKNMLGELVRQKMDQRTQVEVDKIRADIQDQEQ